MKKYDVFILSLAGLAFGMAGFSFLGYVIGVEWMYRWIAGGTGIAIQATMALMALSIAIVLLERR